MLKPSLLVIASFLIASPTAFVPFPQSEVADLYNDPEFRYCVEHTSQEELDAEYEASGSYEIQVEEFCMI